MSSQISLKQLFLNLNVEGKSGAGFTLLELMVVITIILVVMAFTIPRFFDTFTNGDMTSDDAEGIVNLLGIAQSNAAGNRDNDNWGIHLVDNGTTDCNSTTSVDCAVLFKGAIFSSRDTSYDQIFTLTNRNQFGAPDDTDLYFNKRTGTVMSQYGFPQGLVAYWPFTGSTTVDLVSNITDSVQSEALTYVTSTCAMSSGCFLYDGSTSYASSTLANGNLNFTGDVSVSAWVKLNVLQNSAFITKGSGDGYIDFFFGTSEGTMIFYSDSDLQLLSTHDIPDTTSWHHVVFTCSISSPTTYAFYIDNAVDKSGTGCAAHTNSNNSVFFGGTANWPAYLNGYLDEVMVFNRALSAADVDQIYNATSPTVVTAGERESNDIYIVNGVATSTIRLFTNGTAELIPDND